MTAPLTVVLPGDIDDPASPSGGNHYDRRVCDGLRAAREVREVAVPGSWPVPSPESRAALAGALAAVPDGGTVLLDGLAGCGVPELLEAESHRLRLILLVHLPLADETGLPPDETRRLDALERRAVHAAAEVVATSVDAAAGLAARHGLPPGSVHVAAPGVEPAPAVTGSPDGRRLLCVAAVVPRKGQDVLATALNRVAVPWRCVCVGALDRDPGFAAEVRRINPEITFPGTRTGAALDEEYAAADLLVLPSRAETYGMVVTEALARGLPVLATTVAAEALDGPRPGLPTPPDGMAGPQPGLSTPPDGSDRLDGPRPGLLVPPDDPEALAAALTRWLTEPDLRSALRRAATDRRSALPGCDRTVRRLNEVIR